MDAIKSNPSASHLEPIVITALNTGLRKGEILNLKWTQINFRDGYITLDDTKGGEIRKIPMNNRLTEMLKNVKNNAEKEYHLY